MNLLALLTPLSSFLNSIGTLALALLSYFTVREMAEQRREMAEQRREMEERRRELRQPDLLIPTTYYRGTCKNSWQWIQKTESEDVGIRSASIELRNVGLGPAKNVSVKWSFALDEAIQKINSLALEIGAKPVAEHRNRDLIVDGCLTLAQVVVRENGCGITKYEHWLARAELERWAVSAYAGGAAEADRFPGLPVDGGDRAALAAALAATGVSWSQRRLDELRAQAVQLVRAERRAIMRISNELLRAQNLECR